MIFLFGCKQNDDCLINFYISGTVTDSGANPIPSVEIHYTTHYDTTGKVAETDALGKYSYFRGPYTDIGNAHITFKKSGYKDVVTPGIGKGSGACGDQQIIRDAVMEVQ